MQKRTRRFEKVKKGPKNKYKQVQPFSQHQIYIVPDERSGFQTIVIGPLSSTQQIGPLQKHGGVALKLTDATFVVPATGGEGVVVRFRHAAFHVDVFDVVVSVVKERHFGVGIGGDRVHSSRTKHDNVLAGRGHGSGVVILGARGHHDERSAGQHVVVIATVPRDLKLRHRTFR